MVQDQVTNEELAGAVGRLVRDFEGRTGGECDRKVCIDRSGETARVTVVLATPSDAAEASKAELEAQIERLLLEDERVRGVLYVSSFTLERVDGEVDHAALVASTSDAVA